MGLKSSKISKKERRKEHHYRHLMDHTYVKKHVNGNITPKRVDPDQTTNNNCDLKQIEGHNEPDPITNKAMEAVNSAKNISNDLTQFKDGKNTSVSKSNKNVYLCEYCFVEFDNRHELLIHIQDKHFDIEPEIFQYNNSSSTLDMMMDISTKQSDVKGNENLIKYDPFMNFRSCFVPNCWSTSIRYPNKMFIPVPLQPDKREMWFRAVHKFLGPRLKYKMLYCCEDHFDLKKNTTKLKNGAIYEQLVKDGVIPHIFNKKSVEQSLSKPQENQAPSTATKETNIGLPPPVMTLNDLITMPDDLLDVHIKIEEVNESSEVGDWCVDDENYKKDELKDNNSDTNGFNKESETKNIRTNADLDLNQENQKLNKDVLIAEEGIDIENPEDCFETKVTETLQYNYNNSLKTVQEETSQKEHSDSKDENVDVIVNILRCKDCLTTFIKKEDMLQHIKVMHGTTSLTRTVYGETKLERKEDLNSTQTNTVSNAGEMADKLSNEECEAVKRFDIITDNKFNGKFIVEGLELYNVPLTKRKHTCPVCNKKYSYKTYKCHMAEVHGNDRYTCEICNANFKCKRYLRRHVKHQHESGKASRNIGSFKCLECSKYFKNNDCLTHHVRNCHGNQVQCELCNSKLKSIVYLNSHMRRVHYDDGKKHKCRICFKEFKSPRQVKIHMINLHPHTLHPCPNCVRLFCNTVQLKIHLKRCNRNNSVGSKNVEESENDDDVLIVE